MHLPPNTTLLLLLLFSLTGILSASLHPRDDPSKVIDDQNKGGDASKPDAPAAPPDTPADDAPAGDDGGDSGSDGGGFDERDLYVRDAYADAYPRYSEQTDIYERDE
ncbi:hypothetical protein MMC13_002046 [Lambiella insularis]|nr:hypothetical protein [Lambiella insularis]